MPKIMDGVWVLYAWDHTLPEPAWIEQGHGGDGMDLMTLFLRWRDGGQQVRIEWIERPRPETSPDDFKIGTRHDEEIDAVSRRNADREAGV